MFQSYPYMVTKFTGSVVAIEADDAFTVRAIKENISPMRVLFVVAGAVVSAAWLARDNPRPGEVSYVTLDEIELGGAVVAEYWIKFMKNYA